MPTPSVAPHLILNTQEAAGQKVAGFLDMLENEVRNSILLNHPFYRTVAEGRLSHDQVIAFTEQQYFFSTSFAPSIAAVYSRLPEYRVSRVLIDHFLVNEAWGTKEKSAHSSLFRIWLDHLGINEKDVALKMAPETREFISERLRLCSDPNYFVGLGALAFGMEYVNKFIYDIVGEGLRKMGHPSEALVYFDAHRQDEIADYRVIRSIILQSAKSEDDCRSVEFGARRMLVVREAFLNRLWARISLAPV